MVIYGNTYGMDTGVFSAWVSAGFQLIFPAFFFSFKLGCEKYPLASTWS